MQLCTGGLSCAVLPRLPEPQSHKSQQALREAVMNNELEPAWGICVLPLN